jgi:Bacterial Ig-like domain (group 3)
MRRVTFGRTVAVALCTALSLAVAQAGNTRRDTQGAGWAVVPSTILQNLPAGLGFPPELKFGVFGQQPVTVDKFSGPTAVTTVRAGFTMLNGYAVPGVLVLTPDLFGHTFDAQGPLWWAAPTAPVACPASPTLSFYACPGNLVAGIKIEWGDPAQEQLLFFKLGSPSGVQVYDSNDYNCSPQGIDNLGQACQYDNLGTANRAWELAFNCVPSQPAVGGMPAVPGGCSNGGALQWRGMLYTATADLLNSPSALSPDQGPALNEFVFNGGKLYVPPGWQSYFVTLTSLSGPRCEFVAGTALTFSTRVFPVLLTGTPTGAAKLLDGTTVLATSPLDSKGTATFTTALGSGSHSISIAYQGDSHYAPSQSAVDVLVSQDQFGALAPVNCR